MTFRSPWLLLLLALVPTVTVAYAIVQRRPPRYAVRYSNLDVLAAVVGSGRDWRRHIPAALLLAALALLTTALARPMWPASEASERASVILVVDVSGSMLATDVKPSRLVAAQAAVRTFLEKVPTPLQVGMVAFAEEAQVVARPTRDREPLRDGLALLTPGRGTAIGDALQRAVILARVAAGDGKPQQGPLRDAGGQALASILLLSDGAQTRGILTPGQGAELAKRAGIPINTIALGTDEGQIEVGFGAERQLVPVPPDRETLAAIAEFTRGESYDADTAEALDGVYRSLGSRVGRIDVPREVSSVFLAAGAALAAAALGVGALGAARLP